MTSETGHQCALCGKSADPGFVELAGTFPRLVDPARCSECEEAERVHANHERAKIAVVQALERRTAVAARTIPPEMARTSLSHPKFNAGLWLQIECWDPRGIEWLGITGPAGTGKTRCAALLAQRLIMDGMSAHWAPAVEIQEAVETLRTSKASAAKARTFLNRCRSSDVLFLDDLGKNTWEQDLERHLFAIVDFRKTNDLPVIWTSNSTLRELAVSGLLTKERGIPLLTRVHEASRIYPTS